MAVSPTQLAKTGQYNELTTRLLFLLLALVVFRIGTHIPVPGIDANQLRELFSGNSSGLLGIMNMFSGGAISRFSVMALGVMPYISASIIMQLMTYVVPFFEQLKKEGQSGKKKISQYTRYGTLLLALFQSFAVATVLENTPGLVINGGLLFKFTTVVSLTTGTMFLMWLGEQVTERGLGNGISIIIFAGIVSGLPSALASLFTLVANNELRIISLLLILAIALVVTYLVVFIERGQRRIRIEYARRQVGNKVSAPQSSHLPLKLNMAGVIPPIFAMSILTLPGMLMAWLNRGDESSSWISNVAAELAPGQLLHVVLFAVAIIFFCFFYTALVFNSKETADNLKKSGAFVPGIRPGIHTAKYIDKVLVRLTFFGAIYIAAVCLLPEILRAQYSTLPFTIGGTSLLIIVVVAMDFRAQIENYVMSQQYGSLLKKSGFQ